MKSLLILFLVISMGCYSQSSQEKFTYKKQRELKPPFETQGEQEDYWSQEFFKKQYEKQSYPKYTGQVTKTKSTVQFGKFDFVEFVNVSSDHQLIFKKGLLYPKILNTDNLRIGMVKELTFLSDDPKVKRFRLWLYLPNMANPQVYLFEITNSKANKRTNWDSFVKNAELTFIKAGWIVL